MTSLSRQAMTVRVAFVGLCLVMCVVACTGGGVARRLGETAKAVTSTKVPDSESGDTAFDTEDALVEWGNRKEVESWRFVRRTAYAIGGFGGLLIVCGILGSIISASLPIVPMKSCVRAIAYGPACWATCYVMLAYYEQMGLAIVWLAVVVGGGGLVLLILPTARTLFNRALVRRVEGMPLAQAMTALDAAGATSLQSLVLSKAGA